jgi:hypothetical protein
VRATLSILLFCVTLSAAPFRYTDLEAIIRTKHITSIDELLPQLPAEYLRYYTFLYNSHSLQQKYVTPAEPRAIVYGPDAQLLMAFTNRDDSLETIEFDAKADRFVFRALDFSFEKPLDPPPVENPPLCLSCHGQDPRPNWDAYNMWPGAYGSMSRVGCDTIVADTREFNAYTEFLSGKRKQDRYHHLPAELPEDDYCPHDAKVEITVSNAALTHANSDLTQKLSQLNTRRFRRLVEAAPKFRAFRFAWLGLNRKCLTGETIESFFPKKWAQANGFRSYASRLGYIVDRANKDFATQLKAFDYYNKPSPISPGRRPINFMDPADTLGGAQFPHRVTVTLISMLVERMGLSMERMALGFENGQFNFAAPQSYPEVLLSLWAPGTDPVTGEDISKLDCEQLRQKSVEALGRTVR